MTLAYMEETVACFKSHGYALDPRKHDLGEGEYLKKISTYRLKKELSEFELECIRDAEGNERYYLKIEAHHGLQSFSYQLDSWRVYDEKIEFKYYSNPATGTGLSFFLHF